MLHSPTRFHLLSDWAVSLLVCSGLFISLMDIFASRPLHPSNNTASETVKSQQMCPFLSPSFCLLLLGLPQLPLQPVCVAAWLAEALFLTTFLPSLPKNTLPLLPLYFILIPVCSTTVFRTHYHSLFTSTVHNEFFYQSEHLPAPSLTILSLLRII